MREYKFRGQRADTKEWVYGFLAEPNIINVEVKDDSTGFLSYEDYLVLPESVGHFTGKTDNWKKEIWEGDKVKILYTDWPSKPASDPRTLDQYLEDIAIPGEVVFYDGRFCIEVENTKFGGKDYLDMNPGAHGFIKVIGSIHLPELIKQKV
jgi:uncharacterized phage protein (TIGR01671 family)